MKIASVTVVFEEKENDGPKNPTTAIYDSASGLWTLKGSVYPKHMKILTTISDMCREADKK